MNPNEGIPNIFTGVGGDGERENAVTDEGVGENIDIADGREVERV